MTASEISCDDQHMECISDFAGNNTHPGFWADRYRNKRGEEYIKLGGWWSYYVNTGLRVIKSRSRLFKPFIEACDNMEEVEFLRSVFGTP